MNSCNGASIIVPFKFHPRRESVDWRRINALDIDLVMSQLDVDALQEHISTVTFCSLDGERCLRCRSPVDQALVKLFQLAQLTVEWLLHCQECLTLNLRTAEERLVVAGREHEESLAAAGRECEVLLEKKKKLKEKVKELLTELNHRKGIIQTQQSLIKHGIVSQKCPHCEKNFLDSSYLENHMQRCHPDEYESKLHSESERKCLVNSLTLEISNLKEQILLLQQELQTKCSDCDAKSVVEILKLEMSSLKEQITLQELQTKTAQEKEQHNMHKDLQRETDRFKAEKEHMERKLEDSRDFIQREIENRYSQNIQSLIEANQDQTSKYERDLGNYREIHIQTIQRQEEKWESMLHEIKTQQESEKKLLLNELNRIQGSVSDHQEQNQWLQQEMNRKLQEKEQIIKALEEQLTDISSNPSTEELDEPVEPTCTPELDPIQEPPGEERGQKDHKPAGLVSPFLSEKSPLEMKAESALRKKRRVTSRFMVDIKKDLLLDLEHSLIMTLESLGVKSSHKGLKKEELTFNQAKLHSKREGFANGNADYWRHREEIARTVEQKLIDKFRGSKPVEMSQQVQDISSSLTTTPVHMPGVVSTQAPQPKPKRVVFAEPISTLLNPVQEAPEDESAPWKKQKVISIFRR